MDRVKRYEAAPFATEHSLNLQKKQMSDIENQLVKLGLEKTMLETELMKNESLARSAWMQGTSKRSWRVAWVKLCCYLAN